MSCCRLAGFIYSKPMRVHEENSDGFWGLTDGNRRAFVSHTFKKKKRYTGKLEKRLSLKVAAVSNAVNVPCSPEG